MLKIISTHLFLRSRLHPGNLDTLARTGADGIEIFAARNHFDYTDQPTLREIGDWFRANPVKLFSLHAPLSIEKESGRGGEFSVNVLHPDKGHRIDAMDEVKRALETAEQIPFQHLVLHLGDRGDSWDTRTFENALTALEHLQAYARPLGVRLLVENIQNQITTPAHLLEILRVGHLDDVGICLDLGHAHLGDGIPDALEQLSDFVRTTHIHDNHGERDEHLWPGEGTAPLQMALDQLQKAKQQPAGVLEIHYSAAAEPAQSLIDKAQAAFARFNAQA